MKKLGWIIISLKHRLSLTIRSITVPLRTALIVAAIALRKMGRVEDKRPKAGSVGKATLDVAVEDGTIAQVEKRPGIEKENDLARDRDLEEVDLEEKK